MFNRPPAQLPEHIGIFILPKFSMVCFASMLEALRSANRMSGRQLYSWHVISKDGQPCLAANGISVLPESSIANAPSLDALVCCAAFDMQNYDDPQVFAWLRRLSRQSVALGATTIGTYILANAGLLDGYRCTLHWENLDAFQEQFPNLDVTNEVFEIDRDRFTCSGGIAAFDMMLQLIAREHGADLAAQVSEQFIHERIRDSKDSQRMALPARLGVRHPKLLQVVKRMESTLAEPLSCQALARGVKLSSRQLERLFRKYLDKTPTRFYLELRLRHARRLLLQTDMSIMDAALAAGFVSASHFSKCYRDLFGMTPRVERSGGEAGRTG